VTAPANQGTNQGPSASFHLGSFTDPGPDSPWAVTVDWGDGTGPTTFAVTATGSLGSQPHVYALQGTYTVTVRVTDQDGATGSTTFLVTVNATPAAPVGPGQTATIGFWHNKNGQALINSFNGGGTSTALSTWLATNFPKLYGAQAGANNLAGRTNAQVEAYYLTLFNVQDQKLNAQVLATALNVYATTSSLGGTAATKYGFTVTAAGLGASTWNVGASGAAFGVANNTTLSVSQILRAANERAVNGVLYDGDTALRNKANTVFTGINEGGDIG
jgi:hypothetical protein